MLARDQLAECRRLYLRYVGLVALGGAVISLICIVISHDFVRLAFERGAFSTEDTDTVSTVQQAYLLQLPGALVGMLSVRLIAARGAFVALTAANIAIVPLVGLLQWWFASTWGTTGVALGTSVGATVSAAVFVALSLWLTRGDRR
jgi:peptidoglycan biosynthesis protein MviN/MurJ (putative lipid II flippase)